MERRPVPRQRLFCLAVLCLLGPCSVSAQESPGRPGDRSSLPFTKNLEDSLAAAQTSEKPIVVAFVAAWCPLCRQMKEKTFRAPEVLALADRFQWVMIDIDRNLTTAREYAVEAVPKIHLMNPGGQTESTILGLVDAAALQGQLTQYLEWRESGAVPGPQQPGQQPASQESPAEEGGNPRSSLTWTPKGYRGLGICFSHVGYGPLAIPTQSAFQALRLGLRPRTPSTLGKGQYQASASATWVNIWNTGTNFFLDYEMLRTALGLAYGISDTLQIEAEFESRSRFGGEMDGFIQEFHDLAGVDQAGRDEVPRGEFTFDLTPPGGPAISLDSGDRGVFSRSIGVTMQHNVTCGTASLPAFSYAVTVRSETESSGDLGSGSGLDVGLSVAVSRRLGTFYLYGTFGHAWFGRDDFRGLELEGNQSTFLTALEWRFRSDQSLLFQLLLTEGVIGSFDPFSDRSDELTIGWKWEVVDKGILEVGLIENILSFDNSPDFGIHVGFTRRF